MLQSSLLLVLQAEGDERKLLIHERKIMVQRSLEPLRGFCQPLLAFEALFKKEHLRIGRFLRHMALLFSFHERSDGCGEQKTLSLLKKRAKIIVSNLSPADE